MTTKSFKKIAFVKWISQKTLDNTELQFAHTEIKKENILNQNFSLNSLKQP